MDQLIMWQLIFYPDQFPHANVAILVLQLNQYGTTHLVPMETAIGRGM